LLYLFAFEDIYNVRLHFVLCQFDVAPTKRVFGDDNLEAFFEQLLILIPMGWCLHPNVAVNAINHTSTDVMFQEL
jgi:hypothetical protein